MNLFLLGYMGCGKTTLGTQVARKLQMEFLDLDQLITQREGMSVSAIFEQKGEAAFRELETKYIEEACSADGRVIALGGGAPCIEGVMETINENGISVYLKCHVETLVNRLGHTDDRPMLQGKSGEDLKTHISSMLAVREACYNKADFTVGESLQYPGFFKLLLEAVKK